MNLRERCEKLCKKMDVTAFPCVELVESFAREIRAEALEESAIRIEVLADMDKDYGGDPSGRRDLRLLCAGMIRALKDDSATLAAKEYEK